MKVPHFNFAYLLRVWDSFSITVKEGKKKEIYPVKSLGRTTKFRQNYKFQIELQSLGRTTNFRQNYKVSVELQSLGRTTKLYNCKAKVYNYKVKIHNCKAELYNYKVKVHNYKVSI